MVGLPVPLKPASDLEFMGWKEGLLGMFTVLGFQLLSQTRTKTVIHTSVEEYLSVDSAASSDPQGLCSLGCGRRGGTG